MKGKPDQISAEEFTRLFPKATDSAKAANGLVGDGTQKPVLTIAWDATRQIKSLPEKPLDITDRPTTDEQKLNKTEKAYLAYLRMLRVPKIRMQAITLKLADDCRLTVDFTYQDENGRLVFVDVKGGFWREDAKIKIKMAARLFPEFRFVVAHKTKTGWNQEDIKP